VRVLNESRVLFLLFLGILTIGCDAYQPPVPTIPSSPASNTPTHIALNAGSRANEQIGVTALVLTADGRGVPNVSVGFAIGAGTIEPATAMTDQTGTARALAVSTSMTTIAATIGGGIVSFVDVLPSPQP
jgi:pectin methylesterase-like acyl-CoA thioesterase